MFEAIEVKGRCTRMFTQLGVFYKYQWILTIEKLIFIGTIRFVNFLHDI